MTEIEHLYVDANGIRFHVAAAGATTAHPVLFLHGFPEGWASWRRVIEALSDRYRVYAPDLRGYGGTSKPVDGYDLITLTDDIHALREALGARDATLVGHDWGGACAWIYAHRFSATLQRLIVVNCTHPNTFFRAIQHNEDNHFFRSIYMLFIQLPWLPEKLLTMFDRRVLRRGFKMATSRGNTLDEATVDEVVKTFRGPSDFTGPLNYYRAAFWGQMSKAKRTELRQIGSPLIACPTTLIWGTADPFLSERVARKSYLDAGCSVEFRPLQGVGHFVSMERPDLLIAELRAVLDDAGRQRPR